MSFTDLVKKDNKLVTEKREKLTDYVSAESKSIGQIKGPFGPEEAFETTYYFEGDKIATVTGADQGITDIVIHDDLGVAAVLNSLWE